MGLFYCEEYNCDFKARSYKTIKNHLKTHVFCFEDIDLSCLSQSVGEIDELAYVITEELEELVQINEEDLPLICENSKCCECNFVSLDKNELKNHLKIIHNTVLYSCILCDFISISKHYLLKHMRRIHEKFMCSNCDYVTHDADCFQLHIKNEIMPQTFFQCTLCIYAAKKYGFVQTHIDKAHKRKFYCKFCDVLSYNTIEQKKHLEKYHTDKIFKCLLCEYVTYRNCTLDRHVKTFHRPKFNCEICDNPIRTRRFLTLHKKKPIRNRAVTHKYMCQFCDYSICTARSYKRHVQKNHNENVISKQ